jgi:hypothetical protein
MTELFETDHQWASVSVEPDHLFRYLNEQAYRFNNWKDMKDFDRFRLAMTQVVGKRLDWDNLTGKGLDLQTRDSLTKEGIEAREAREMETDKRGVEERRNRNAPAEGC